MSTLALISPPTTDSKNWDPLVRLIYPPDMESLVDSKSKGNIRILRNILIIDIAKYGDKLNDYIRSALYSNHCDLIEGTGLSLETYSGMILKSISMNGHDKEVTDLYVTMNEILNVKNNNKGLPQCACCHRLVGLKKCACRKVRYCSLECQRSDWQNHKENCIKKQ